MYEIAHTLGQPLSVVLAMTVDEFTHWFTFLRVKSEKGRQNVGKQHTPKTSGKGRNKTGV